MRNLEFLNNHYKDGQEEGRLKTKVGNIEYITTMKMIHEYLQEGMRILEVGAGTGRYSLALADEGVEVDAIELVEENLNILKSHIKENYKIHAYQGDALDLSLYEDEIFDMTLLLGPMYHLYHEEDKVRCLKEALRVTKKEGIVLVAYCMNEATILQFGFMRRNILDCVEKKMITDDFKCLSEEKDIFELVRIEDIDHINSQCSVERIKLVSSDGPSNYLAETIEQMDEETYRLYIDYHLKTCERSDLIGAGNHVLDILRKI